MNGTYEMQSAARACQSVDDSAKSFMPLAIGSPAVATLRQVPQACDD
jgi:hypothetical protein